jgi:hypothetical protein
MVGEKLLQEEGRSILHMVAYGGRKLSPSLSRKKIKNRLSNR